MLEAIKVSTTLTVEERLSILEKEVAELKHPASSVALKQSWLDCITGSFKGDPEFGEILRLGREIRNADKTEDANGDE
jgi:hypothetical protein